MKASLLSRFVACLTCTLLLLPPAGAAAGSAACDRIAGSLIIQDESLPADVDLRVTIARDGTAKMHGFIRQRGSDAPVLEARGAARADCTDLDGDGTAGLVKLAADFRDADRGERVRVVLAPVAHDVDASGVYRATIDVAESGMIGDIRTVISAEAA